MSSRPGRRARTLPWAAVVLVAALGAGCTASGTSPPVGVDGLEVPTPAPDPQDFVARVDHPWLPLTPGSVWFYESGGDTVVRTVADRPGEVAGVRTVVVETVGGGVRTTDQLAQDAEGNVWWLAHEEESGSWEAGVDGVEAGLAVPATPRVGDGWFAVREPDGSGVVVSTVAVDQEIAVEAGELDDVVVLTSTAPDGLTTTYRLARGTGLVRADVVGGPDLELTAYTPGPRPR